MQLKTFSYLFIICISTAPTVNAMSASSPSVAEIEHRLCILHEHSQKSKCRNPEITEAIHLFPSENSFTKVTHFCTTSEKESDELVQKICSKYHKLWWYVTPNTKKFNLEQRLQEKGVKPYALTAMACSLVSLTMLSEDPRVQRRLNAESDQEWQNFLADLSSQPRKDLLKSPNQPKPEDQNIMNFGLMHNNKLISIGALFFHDNWAAIFNIATDKAEQRKGFATILMKHLLYVAKHRGVQCAILEASPEGKKLYENCGFKDIFTEHIYYRQ